MTKKTIWKKLPGKFIMESYAQTAKDKGKEGSIITFGCSPVLFLSEIL